MRTLLSRLLTSFRSISTATWLVAFVAIGGLAESAFLYKRNVELGQQAEVMRFDVLKSDAVAVGEKLQEVVGFSPDGRRLGVDVTGNSRVLIFTLSSQCPYCAASMPAFARLASEATVKGIKVVFVSKDDIKYMLWKDLPGTTIAEPTHWTYEHLKLQLVPQAVLISGGRVEKAITGQLVQAKEQEMATALSK